MDAAMFLDTFVHFYSYLLSIPLLTERQFRIDFRVSTFHI